MISLVFDWYEVRQSNETRIQAATRALVSEHIDSVRMLSEDGELACIYAVGVQDYDG